MASIVPPLDFIPKLPGVAVGKIVEQIDIQADKLLDQVSKLIQDSIKLPINIKCDDPRIEKMKKQLAVLYNILVYFERARVYKREKVKNNAAF